MAVSMADDTLDLLERQMTALRDTARRLERENVSLRAEVKRLGHMLDEACDDLHEAREKIREQNEHISTLQAMNERAHTGSAREDRR